MIYPAIPLLPSLEIEIKRNEQPRRSNGARLKDLRLTRPPNCIVNSRIFATEIRARWMMDIFKRNGNNKQCVESVFLLDTFREKFKRIATKFVIFFFNVWKFVREPIIYSQSFSRISKFLLRGRNFRRRKLVENMIKGIIVVGISGRNRVSHKRHKWIAR